MDARLQEQLRQFAATGDQDAAVAACQAMLRLRGESGLGSPVRIPTIGTRITLTEDWTFTLYGEHRNVKFWLKIHGTPKGVDEEDAYLYDLYERDDDGDITKVGNEMEEETTLPAGSVLRVDRLYIKKNQGDYDSVTFFCESIPDSDYTRERLPFMSKKVSKVVGRFWVKLDEVNKIMGCWEASTMPKARL